MSQVETRISVSSESDETAPLLSIGVFTHNHERFVGECLRSISSFHAYEVTITDDGSQDETQAVIVNQLQAEGFRNAHVRTILDVTNHGFVRRLNHFLDSMRGEWFLLLSGDDKFVDGGIDHLLEVAHLNPGVDVVFSRFGRIDERGHPLSNPVDEKRYHALGRKFEKPENPFRSLMSSGSFVPGGCTLVRSDFVRRHSIRFNSLLTNAEDYDFWLQCASSGATFVYTERKCWDYRVLATSKYHSAGPERLRSELLAVGRHRSDAPTVANVGGLVWGIQMWKGQYLARAKTHRMGAQEAASLLDSSVLAILFALPIVLAQSIFRRWRGWR